MFAKPQLNGDCPEAFTHELLNVIAAADDLLAALRGLRATCFHARNYQHSQAPAEDRASDLQTINTMMEQVRAARLWAEKEGENVAQLHP